jgi:hypothetical protein
MDLTSYCRPSQVAGLGAIGFALWVGGCATNAPPIQWSETTVDINTQCPTQGSGTILTGKINRRDRYAQVDPPTTIWQLLRQQGWQPENDPSKYWRPQMPDGTPMYWIPWHNPSFPGKTYWNPWGSDSQYPLVTNSLTTFSVADFGPAGPPSWFALPVENDTPFLACVEARTLGVNAGTKFAVAADEAAAEALMAIQASNGANGGSSLRMSGLRMRMTIPNPSGPALYWDGSAFGIAVGAKSGTVTPRGRFIECSTGSTVIVDGPADAVLGWAHSCGIHTISGIVPAATWVSRNVPVRITIDPCIGVCWCEIQTPNGSWAAVLDETGTMPQLWDVAAPSAPPTLIEEDGFN